LKSSALDYFQERKIKNRVEDSTADVVQDLKPFLDQEKIPVEKQQHLIETCVNELKPFAENPSELFKGSLDGQKIFENLYHEKELPQVIIEDDLKDTYTLLFPRVATLLCKIPAAVKDWENEAWSENYRRFDEVISQLKALFAQVDELASAPKRGADATLIQFKRMLAQKVGLQLDITGLRADQPYSGKFDDFFVLPEIKNYVKEEDPKEKAKASTSIFEPKDCFCTFTNSNCLSIIVGAPGAGKSTWTKWLQRETLRADWAGIGIRVGFRDLVADELPSTYELIRMVAGKQLAEDLTAEKIRKWLDDWNVVFILDGFDEVKPSDRDRFVNWIKEICEFAKGCPFVITSRPMTTNHLEMFRNDWQKWSIEPFDAIRIITYITKWYANSPLLTDSNRKIPGSNGICGLEEREA
jgi:predicted NACHT family NTPase